MKINFSHTYETCVHSKKRKQADWKVFNNCPHPNRVFTGKGYALPNTSMCLRCRDYQRDDNLKDGAQ